MHQVDDAPMETLHIYFERDAAPKPSLLLIFLSVVALSLLVAFGVLSPTQQPVTRAVIRVPAVLLPPRTFTAVVPVIPTGIKTYPATISHGWIIFTNGSIIGQDIPAGFTIDGVATDRAVYVPPGSADGYGYATVQAHALISGKQRNIPALAINTAIGSSLYIRNLSAFSGGRDSYSVKVVTVQDKQTAQITARNLLATEAVGLHYPCQEIVNNQVSIVNLFVTWRCQFVTYHIPAFYHVTGVKITGTYLVLAVWFVPRTVHIWGK